MKLKNYCPRCLKVPGRSIKNKNKINLDGTWRLSPAYDLTFSVDLADPGYVNRHSFSVNGKYENITREDLEIVGQNNDIQNYKNLIDNVAGAVSMFSKYAREVGVAQRLIDSIGKEFL